MTGGALIAEALRVAGALRSGQTAAAHELADALTAVNDLLDSMSTDGDLVYSVDKQTGALISGTQAYTAGPSGTLYSTRPIQIEAAAVTASGQSWPVEVIGTAAAFAARNVLGATSDIPELLFCDYALPVANIRVWPVPSYAASLDIWALHPFAQFPDLVTDVKLAPGYAQAIKYRLALVMAGRLGTTPIQGAQDDAAGAMGVLRALNQSIRGGGAK